jgi:hypothetical protein
MAPRKQIKATTTSQETRYFINRTVHPPGY